MKRKSFEAMRCPIALSLEHVGEWWSILILRDAMTGVTRFEDFQNHLEISPNTLSRRLSALVDSGFLARRPYRDSPPRVEYILTPRGRDFEAILMALAAFGTEHFFNEKRPGQIVVSRKTGEAADIQVIDGQTGQLVGWDDYTFAEGSGKVKLARRVRQPRASRPARSQA